MGEGSQLESELSIVEKRVLLTLVKLKGTGSPEQLRRAMLPSSIAKLSDSLESTLGTAFADAGITIGPNQITTLMDRLLKNCLTEDDKAMTGCVVSTLIGSVSHQLVNLDVPVQRSIIGKLLGDCTQAVSSALKEAMTDNVDMGFVGQVEMMNSCSWLRSKGLVEMSEGLEKYYSLISKRGKSSELPERRALKILKKAKGVIPVDELRKDKNMKSDEVPIALGWLKRKGWARIEKRGAETVIEITEDGKAFLGKKGLDEELIERLAEGEKHEFELDHDIVEKLLKRQDIIKVREVIVRAVTITDKGRNIAGTGLELGEEISQLTPALIQSGGWKGKSIRRYNIDTFAPDLIGGKMHPLQQYIEKVRGIFLSMGFEEIDYGFVQSAFWNMDALFTAQDHPVREMHDTLYLESVMDLPDEELVERVKTMHESGDDESDGWQYRWDEGEAKRALLRTHTTVNTIRYLAEHPDPPVKVFTVGPVFRNETVDATHLPEFNHVEGIVMEEGANLRMLIGQLKEFYSRMGLKEIRIRPAYFPYTEPSLEVEIFFNGQWMELGGAGIFRPEVTRPLGVRHPVLAWGLGLERLVMTLLDMKDMRKLYISDIDWLRNSPAIK